MKKAQEGGVVAMPVRIAVRELKLPKYHLMLAINEGRAVHFTLAGEPWVLVIRLDNGKAILLEPDYRIRANEY